jgi:hypothetical protein
MQPRQVGSNLRFVFVRVFVEVLFRWSRCESSDPEGRRGEMEWPLYLSFLTVVLRGHHDQS